MRKADLKVGLYGIGPTDASPEVEAGLDLPQGC